MMDQQQQHEEERRFVQKLLRYYLYRCIQVILQSRSGKPFRCLCRPHSTTEMLGLSLEDDPAIALSIKQKLTSGGGPRELRHGDAQSVEIFLANGDAEGVNSDADRQFLEVWTFRFAEDCEPAVRRAKAFDRLVVALKALWSVARVLPAYRVARRHTGDRRVLCYCVLPSASDPALLGPGYQNRRVASVRTSAGALTLTCAFCNPVRLGPVPLRLHEGHYGLVASDSDSEPDCDRVGVDDVDGAPPPEDEPDAAPASLPSLPRSLTPPSLPSPHPPPSPSLFLAGPFGTRPDCGAGEHDAACAELPLFKTSSDNEDDQEDIDDDELSEHDGEGDAESGEGDVASSRPVTGAAAAASALADMEAADDSEFPPFAWGSSAADLQRLERLKSGVRLEMFAAPHPLHERIGDIPRQLEFFERDLAEFDVLLNSMLERDSDAEGEGAS